MTNITIASYLLVLVFGTVQGLLLHSDGHGSVISHREKLRRVNSFDNGSVFSGSKRTVKTPLDFASRDALQDTCLDSQENRVSLGERYFDGTEWRICNKTDVNARLRDMEKSWMYTFLSLDRDRDELITLKDLEIIEKKFIGSFNPRSSEEADVVWALIEEFFHCTLLYGLKETDSIDKDAFISTYRKAFTTKRLTMIKQSNVCNFYLASAIDQNGDEFISYEELFIEFKAWDVFDKKLEKKVFELMGPNDDNLLPIGSFVKLYTEFSFGTNREFFDAMQKAYVDAGAIPKL